MKVLLDTHILVWLAAGDPQLPDPLAQRLQQPDLELLISAASAWELSIKYHLGKLPSAEPILADLELFAAKLGASWLNITAAHALGAGALDWAHRDPFDRLLVAQALAEGLRLVTLDGQITGYAPAPLFS